MYILLKQSNLSKKKYTAIVYNSETQKKIKTIHFGQKGAKDYLLYNEQDGLTIANQRKSLYYKRNYTRQNKLWESKPLSPATLSKYLLWNKPTLNESIDSYLSKFPEIKKIIINKSVI